MLRVVEIAGKIGKSKTAIYNKINENQALFKPYIKKVEGVKMIDTEGFNLLLKLFNLNDVETDLENNTINSNNTNALSEIILVKNEIINELKNQINYLEQQSQKKDELIDNQSRQLENFQVLLKQEQSKALYIGENIQTKRFWERIFKK